MDPLRPNDLFEQLAWIDPPLDAKVVAIFARVCRRAVRPNGCALVQLFIQVAIRAIVLSRVERLGEIRLEEDSAKVELGRFLGARLVLLHADGPRGGAGRAALRDVKTDLVARHGAAPDTERITKCSSQLRVELENPRG